MAVGKITHQVNPTNYLSLRYGFNDNTQPYGASPQAPPENWGISKNKFHSANAEPQLGPRRRQAQRVRVPVLLLPQHHHRRTRTLPTETVPERRGRRAERQHAADDRAAQVPVPRRLHLEPAAGTSSRSGASFIYEPVLDITFSTGPARRSSPTSTDSRTSPICNITFNGSIGGGSGGNIGKIPNNQYGALPPGRLARVTTS